MIILANLENYNAILIKENKTQEERFLLLQKEFKSQEKLFDNNRMEKIGTTKK